MNRYQFKFLTGFDVFEIGNLSVGSLGDNIGKFAVLSDNSLNGIVNKILDAESRSNQFILHEIEQCKVYVYLDR